MYFIDDLEQYCSSFIYVHINMQALLHLVHSKTIPSVYNLYTYIFVLKAHVTEIAFRSTHDSHCKIDGHWKKKLQRQKIKSSDVHICGSSTATFHRMCLVCSEPTPVLLCSWSFFWNYDGNVCVWCGVALIALCGQP